MSIASPPIDAEFEVADGYALEVPAEAHTLAGFRSWVHSGRVPEKRRVSFIQGKVFVDLEEQGIGLFIPAEAHTLAGFRSWALSDEVPEKLRVSYLRGKVTVDMSKEEILTHAAVKTAIAGTLFNLNEALDFGDLYINGVLVTNAKADVSNNPDMVAIRWESLESGKVRYVSSRKNREVEIEGSPDWVLEIVSPKSVAKDTRELRQAYHRAGIREYWVVDARGEEIDFRIFHWRKAGYVVAAARDGWLRSRVFPRQLQLTRKRDRRGGWRYLLALKEV
jgi:Uma2 family endonuclease